MIRVRKVDAQRVQQVLNERIQRALAGNCGNTAKVGQQVLAIPRVFASAQEEARVLQERCTTDGRHLVVVLWGAATKEVRHG